MSKSPKAMFLNEAVERRYGFSRAVQFGDLLFVSGTVSVGPDGKIIGADCMRSQVEQVYAALAEILSNAGSAPDKVLKETVFATDIDAFLQASEPRLAFYAAGLPPATTGVEVRRLARPGLLVEIELIAALQSTSASD